MSSSSDIYVMENSLNDNLQDTSTVYFNDKNYVFITDSTSNSGSFTSGMIQFDLSSLASQSSRISFQDGIVEFPVKVNATVDVAATGTTANTTAGIHAAIIKNGWHQFIDTAQLIIDGQTIQSAQPYENVAATFRILSSWSQDTLQKWGSSCGITLDDCTADTQATLSNTIGLSNATFSTMATSIKGFDVVNNQSLVYNKGIPARASITNNDVITATATQLSILGNSSMKNLGKGVVEYLAGGTNTAGASFFTAYYMATVRIRDLFDINDLPLMKNLKGFLYLTFNSTKTSLSMSTAGALSSVSYNTLTGRTNPILINIQTTGINSGSGSTLGPTIGVSATVDGTTSGSLSTKAGPLLVNARLLVPAYSCNPKTDEALSNPSKFFTTLEKIIVPITVTAGGTVSYTITTGVPNPRRLTIHGMWQNLGGATLPNPEVSAFETVPATTGPFMALQNFQVYLANKPLYQYPITYTFEQWLSENSDVGLNGNVVNEDTSGLLSQKLFEQNHAIYTVNLSKRTIADDGASKSVQVNFTNPSAAYGMKAVAIVWYEKQWVMNTDLCKISQV